MSSSNPKDPGIEELNLVYTDQKVVPTPYELKGFTPSKFSIVNGKFSIDFNPDGSVLVNFDKEHSSEAVEAFFKTMETYFKTTVIMAARLEAYERGRKGLPLDE